MMTRTVTVGTPLQIQDVVDVARGHARVTLSDEAVARMIRARAVVDEHLADGEPHYGINTGFGALAEVSIGFHDLAKLQVNLIRSHASGIGDHLEPDVVRAAMLLRAQVLATGSAGARPKVAELLIAMLNHDVLPVIPSRGSVGASGDLAPLAHMALAMIGEGEVLAGRDIMPASDALSAKGLAPLVLAPKEGLALVNGTQVHTAMGVLALVDAENLALSADILGAMSLEAVLGTPAAFDPRVVGARPHPGQVASGAFLTKLLADSEIRESHRHCMKVQDPYSLRCMPQVHGAVRDSLDHCRRVLEIEINSATDNPLVFETGEILSGGNFHGEPIAIALDLMGIAVAELGSISERRVEHLLNPSLSNGLTAFLASDSGLCSGLMIAQVAAASLVSENKVLAHPASVDSIPSSANREDHVSMGMTAALKARSIVDNVRNILAVEGLCASAGVDERMPNHPGRGVRTAHARVRDVVAPLTDDRPPAPDIRKISELLKPGGGLVESVLLVIDD